MPQYVGMSLVGVPTTICRCRSLRSESFDIWPIPKLQQVWRYEIFRSYVSDIEFLTDLGRQHHLHTLPICINLRLSAEHLAPPTHTNLVCGQESILLV